MKHTRSVILLVVLLQLGGLLQLGPIVLSLLFAALAITAKPIRRKGRKVFDKVLGYLRFRITRDRLTDQGWRVLAVHEMGHALVQQLLKELPNVAIVTVIPQGNLPGYMLAEACIDDHTPEQMEADMAVYLAGCAAERLIYGHTWRQCRYDRKHATKLAWEMVAKCGMEKYRQTYLKQGALSEQIRHDMHQLVEAKLAAAEKRATELLESHRTVFERAVDELLIRGKLTGKDLEELMPKSPKLILVAAA